MGRNMQAVWSKKIPINGLFYRTTWEHRGAGGGAQGRNRTTDTAIFSRVLYQLSYLGAAPVYGMRTGPV